MGPRGRGVLGRLVGGAGPATPPAHVAPWAWGERGRGGNPGGTRVAAAPAGARRRGEPGDARAGGPGRGRQGRRPPRGGAPGAPGAPPRPRGGGGGAAAA